MKDEIREKRKHKRLGGYFANTLYGGMYREMRGGVTIEGAVSTVRNLKCNKCRGYENGCDQDECKHCEFCNESEDTLLTYLLK